MTAFIPQTACPLTSVASKIERRPCGDLSHCCSCWLRTFGRQSTVSHVGVTCYKVLLEIMWCLPHCQQSIISRTKTYHFYILDTTRFSWGNWCGNLCRRLITPVLLGKLYNTNCLQTTEWMSYYLFVAVKKKKKAFSFVACCDGMLGCQRKVSTSKRNRINRINKPSQLKVGRLFFSA